MKLCRFELKSEPGRARSGMVFGGKVYETDGATAIAVYQPDEVRPLAPLAQAPSLRLYRNDLQPLPGSDEDPRFFYGNPACLFGASQTLNHPGIGYRVTFEPYLAAVLVSGGYKVELEEADDLILGYTLLSMLVAPDLPPHIGRSHDLGAAIGPVMTTPDELDDFLADQRFGRRYALSAVGRVNGVERSRGNVEDLPFSFAQAIHAASQSCALREGDIFAFGPITEPAEPILLEGGDEVGLAVENLGTLTFRLSEEI